MSAKKALKYVSSTTAVLVAVGIMGGFISNHAKADMHGNMKMEGNMKMGGEHDEEITFGMPGMAKMVSRTVSVTMKDAVYNLKNLTVKNGETIRFIVINKDDIDHEFTLGSAEMQAEDRERMAKMAEMDKPMDMAGEENAVSVPALETKELIWTFKGPGQIEFACNIPGHYDNGMHGDIMIDGN